MEYNEGKNALSLDIARALGYSEAAIRASDPRVQAIALYAGELYDKVRSGEMTPEEAAEELSTLGFARTTGTALGGNRGDIAALSSKSLIAGVEKGADSPIEENEYKNIRIGDTNFQISEASAFEGFASDGGTPTIKQDTSNFIKDAPTLKDVESNKKTIAGIEQDFVPPHMRETVNANTETPSAGTVDANRVSQPTETPEKEKTTDSKQPNSSTNSQD